MDEITTIIEGIDSRARENSVSILVGYSLLSTEGRLLQEDNEEILTEDEPVKNVVNETATGALIISFVVALIAAFGLIMMGNIQTPISFARRDLVKGSINK